MISPEAHAFVTRLTKQFDLSYSELVEIILNTLDVPRLESDIRERKRIAQEEADRRIESRRILDELAREVPLAELQEFLATIRSRN
jgi:hypothetical protein